MNFFSPVTLNVTAREARAANRPVLFQRPRENSRSDGATEVMLTLAPIDAGATERTLLALKHVDLDAATDEKLSPLPGEAHHLVAPLKHVRRRSSARRAPRRSARRDDRSKIGRDALPLPWGPASFADARLGPPRSPVHSMAMRHVGVGDSKIAGAAFFSTDDDPGGSELCGDARSRSTALPPASAAQFSHGQRMSRHQGHDHVGPRRIANQGCGDRNVGAVFHSLTVAKPFYPVNVRV